MNCGMHNHNIMWKIRIFNLWMIKNVSLLIRFIDSRYMGENGKS